MAKTQKTPKTPKAEKNTPVAPKALIGTKHAAPGVAPIAHTKEFRDGTKLTATSTDGGESWQSSADGLTYSSLSALAQAYQEARGKKGTINGRAFFGLPPESQHSNAAERDVKALRAMVEHYAAHPEIGLMFGNLITAIQALPVPVAAPTGIKAGDSVKLSEKHVERYTGLGLTIPATLTVKVVAGKSARCEGQTSQGAFANIFPLAHLTKVTG